MPLPRWSVLPLTMLLAAAPGSATPAQEEEPPAPQGGRYLLLELEGSLPEAPSPLAILQGAAPTLADLLTVLRETAEDEEIDGLMLKFKGGFLPGWAQAQELRSALAEFRDSNKPIVAYLQEVSHVDYLVACEADRVVLAPEGMLFLHGLRAEILHLKGFLDKIGVSAEFARRGKYKNAAEPLTDAAPSEATREEMNALLDDYYDQMIQAIAHSRRKEPIEIRQILNRGPFADTEALEAGLVDAVQYEDELLDQLKKEHGGALKLARTSPREEPVDLASFSGWIDFYRRLLQRGVPEETEPHLAALFLVGPIVEQADENPFLAPQAIDAGALSEEIRKLRRNEQVKGVVLRIDSPGGSVLASDQLWHEIERLRAEKPVVASMGNVAASGGYYLAMGCDRIVADPGTITGSIGVLAGKFQFRGLQEKLGLHTEIFYRGSHGRFFSGSIPMDDLERAFFETSVERTYRRFVRKAAQGRGLSEEAMEELAQGRVWSGRQAQAHGLVDELGGFERALSIALEQANLEEARVIHYPRPKGLMEMLQQLTEGVAAPGSPLMEGIDPQIRGYLRQLRLLEKTRGPLALLPWQIRIR
jgi:protease-4